MVTRGATKGGGRVLKHPQPKIVVSCNSARSDDFFIRGGTCTCTIMDTSVISLKPSQSHTYQTTSVPVFLNSQTVNDRWGAFENDPTTERCRHTCKLMLCR